MIIAIADFAVFKTVEHIFRKIVILKLFLCNFTRVNRLSQKILQISLEV